MKLWLLKPQKEIEGENPWDPWYDKAQAFVVRAETETDARAVANSEGGDETGPVAHIVYRRGGDPWLDPKMSTCEELLADGVPGVIVRDFASA